MEGWGIEQIFMLVEDLMPDGTRGETPIDFRSMTSGKLIGKLG